MYSHSVPADPNYDEDEEEDEEEYNQGDNEEYGEEENPTTSGMMMRGDAASVSAYTEQQAPTISIPMDGIAY